MLVIALGIHPLMSFWRRTVILVEEGLSLSGRRMFPERIVSILYVVENKEEKLEINYFVIEQFVK